MMIKLTHVSNSIFFSLSCTNIERPTSTRRSLLLPLSLSSSLSRTFTHSPLSLHSLSLLFPFKDYVQLLHTILLPLSPTLSLVLSPSIFLSLPLSCAHFVFGPKDIVTYMEFTVEAEKRKKECPSSSSKERSI